MAFWDFEMRFLENEDLGGRKPLELFRARPVKVTVPLETFGRWYGSGAHQRC